jgi:RNA polymerase sigma-70 factor (ECF subfamily)
VVTAFLGGEERAFQELVSRYQTRLLNFVYRTIGDREKAEDLVQEVFIRVYRHIGRFDRSKKFSTWIYTIASNLAKNELRNRSRNPLVLFQTIKKNWQDEDRPLQFEDTTARPDDLYRKRHLRELVEEAVAKLPEHHREVFVLRELEGKSYEEIAEITSCNLGTVGHGTWDAFRYARGRLRTTDAGLSAVVSRVPRPVSRPGNRLRGTGYLVSIHRAGSHTTFTLT